MWSGLVLAFSIKMHYILRLFTDDKIATDAAQV